MKYKNRLVFSPIYRYGSGVWKKSAILLIYHDDISDTAKLAMLVNVIKESSASRLKLHAF